MWLDSHFDNWLEIKPLSRRGCEDHLLFLGFFMHWLCSPSGEVKFKMANGQECSTVLNFTQIVVQSVRQSSDYLTREMDFLLPEERMPYMDSNSYCF